MCVAVFFVKNILSIFNEKKIILIAVIIMRLMMSEKEQLKCAVDVFFNN